MKALVISEAGKNGKPGKTVVEDIPVPNIRPDYIKVRVKAIGLNPTDWKHIDYISDAGARVGCDLAGVVEEVGSDVKASVKKGDTVYGFSHGGNISNHEDGAFGEYCLLKDGVFAIKPDNLSFEDAATLPCGVGTVGQGMYQSLGLPLPTETKNESEYILIYGGSSATGTLAIQFAVVNGLKVVTTASPKNHELLKSLGAEACFDYNDPECGQKIREYTQDKLRYVFDTITKEQSMKIGCAALSSTTEHGPLFYNALSPLKDFPRQDVRFRFTLLYTAVGDKYEKFGKVQEPVPEDHAFITKWFALSQKYIADGQVKPHPKTVGHGYDAIIEGLDKMRKGEHSAQKLVYTID